MNRNELVEKIAAMVLESPDLLTALEEMAKGTTDAEPAAEQRPDMMYVLTQKVKVHTEDGSELYHYHPIVGETLLFAGCTRNRMISSPNLLELQNMAREIPNAYCCRNQILALKTEEYDRLQTLLDKTVTAIIDNTHRAVEAVLENGVYMRRDALPFESIYERIVSEMMYGSHCSVGAALDADSRIVESIEGVEYEYPQCECECDDDCDEEYDEYDEDEEEDDDEPGDFPSGLYRITRMD